MRFPKHRFSALILLLVSCTTFAQTTEHKLTASDGGSGDLFGRDVSIYGDIALVGAYGDDENGNSSGSAYVFRWDGSTWNEEHKLTASDGEENKFFGFDVSVYEDVALVGAWGDNDNGDFSGSAYIFRWDGTTWNEEQKLTPSDGATFDFFGIDVSAHGDVALVGSFWDDDNDTNSGSAYVFRWDGNFWNEEQKLTASDGTRSDGFGWAVALDANIALIGAPCWSITNECFISGLNGGDDYSGSAYVFRYDGKNWVEEQQLTPSDGVHEGHFGYAVSVYDDVALVGAEYDTENGFDSGAAYVFRWDGTSWIEEQKLTPSDATTGDVFGRDVSVYEDIAIVSAPGNDDNGADSGAAYIFEWDGSTWNEEQKLTASDAGEGDMFGGAVSVHGDIKLVGARSDDDNGDFSGSAYVYSPKVVPVEPAPNDPPNAVLDVPQPNPARGQSIIRFTVQEVAATTLTLHDLLGRQVATLYSGTPVPNHSQSVRIDGSELPSGIYFAQLRVGGVLRSTQKVVLLR